MRTALMQMHIFCLIRKFRGSIYDCELFLKATNLFNKSYYEVSGVPLPGRWITAGVKFKIGK